MITLLPNCGFLSETSRMLEIARALDTLGVEFQLASHGGPYEDWLDQSEFPWTRLPPRIDDEKAAQFLERLVNMGFGEKALLSKKFIRKAVRAERDFFKRVNADVAVIGFNLTSFLSSQLANIPLATSHGGSYVPPVFERNLAPAPVNPPVAALGWLPKYVNRWLANFIPPRLGQPMAFLNEMAEELGVEPIPSIAAAMCGDLTLVTDMPEVLGIPKEELESWQPSKKKYKRSIQLRYVGPMFARLDASIPAKVETFLKRTDPIVYLSPTSVTRDFLAGLVRTVKEMGINLVVSSTVHDISELEDERTCIVDILPNHRVMPKVDLVIIMGGQGSVQCAMTSGTPIIGFPHHGEQELNLALAERQGMAKRLPPNAAHTTLLIEEITKMLKDPNVQNNARRVQSLYEDINGGENAANAIINYL